MSIKTKRRCPSCHSSRIGVLEGVRDSSVDHLVVGQLATGLLRRNVGTIEAYVCTECGLYQPFIRHPRTIPYEQLQGFHWLAPRPAAGGPYR